jgi:hypothetical protein
MKKLVTAFSIGLMTCSSVNAVEAIYSSVKPYVKIDFTKSEKQQHLNDVDFIVAEASRCMSDALVHHDSFYRKYGISPFFGDQSSYGKLSWSDRKDYLKNMSIKKGISYPENMVSEIKPFSCVGLAIKCLGKGFRALGADRTWNKIAKYTRDYGQTGLSMQHALQQLGWTSVYWNADTTRNDEWDAKDKKKYPDNKRNYWGQHKYTYEINVLRNRRYYFNKVDNFTFLADFEKNPPAKLKDIPFFLGVANLGYHVFLGSAGKVVEGHSTRSITDYQTIETSQFNPRAGGGGPRGNYFSGLIVVPPFFIDKDSEETRIAKKAEVEARNAGRPVVTTTTTTTRDDDDFDFGFDDFDDRNDASSSDDADSIEWLWFN